jgi:hypothetical protein
MIRLDLFSNFSWLSEPTNHDIEIHQVRSAMMIDKSTHEQSTDNAFNATLHSISLQELTPRKAPSQPNSQQDQVPTPSKHPSYSPPPPHSNPTTP